MALVYAYQDRTLVHEITIRRADSVTITPGENDHVRVIIGREGATPKLTISSEAPTANGSNIVVGSPTVLSIEPDDLEFDPGVYSMLVDYFDRADVSEWKRVDEQVFVLEGEME